MHRDCLEIRFGCLVPRPWGRMVNLISQECLRVHQATAITSRSRGSLPCARKRSCVRTCVKLAENVVTNYWLRIAASTQHLLDRGCMHLLVTDFLTGKLL